MTESVETIPDRDPRIGEMDYLNAIPVKALFGVWGDDVRTYSDLIQYLEGKIDYIRDLERDGWEFDWQQSRDWLIFHHSDRTVAIDHLGLENVLDDEQQLIEAMEEEEEAALQAATV